MKDVDSFLCQAERTINAQNRPLVTLTYAQSLDGSIAYQPGTPLAISGSTSMQITHRLRAAHDGILVGIGTVLADNPQLNVRFASGADPQPIVLDTGLRFPLDSKLLSNQIRPWLFCAKQIDLPQSKELQQRGCRVFHVDIASNGGLDLGQVLQILSSQGIRRLMVEGGARVISGFLNARLVDAVVLTVAPVFVGGLKALEHIWQETGHNFPRLDIVSVDKAGEDIMIWGLVSKGS
jgi:3,4-dihydroxy 2-butanone 4-phosphate synthase/GTP cyclohydrolase II